MPGSDELCFDRALESEGPSWTVLLSSTSNTPISDPCGMGWAGTRRGGTAVADSQPTHLMAECHKIAEDSLYTAQAHFEVASAKGRAVKLWLQLLPAIATALSGIIVALGGPPWWGAIAALSGVLTGVAAYLGVDKETASHTVAAKLFTKLRHDARALADTFSKDMPEAEFRAEVKKLRDRYANYVESCPDTDDGAFEKARKKIQDGRFQPDLLAPQATKAPPATSVDSSKEDD